MLKLWWCIEIHDATVGLKKLGQIRTSADQSKAGYNLRIFAQMFYSGACCSARFPRYVIQQTGCQRVPVTFLVRSQSFLVALLLLLHLRRWLVQALLAQASVSFYRKDSFHIVYLLSGCVVSALV